MKCFRSLRNNCSLATEQYLFSQFFFDIFDVDYLVDSPNSQRCMSTIFLLHGISLSWTLGRLNNMVCCAIFGNQYYDQQYSIQNYGRQLTATTVRVEHPSLNYQFPQPVRLNYILQRRDTTTSASQNSDTPTITTRSYVDTSGKCDIWRYVSTRS